MSVTHVCGCARADCVTSHRRALAACSRQPCRDCRGGCDRPPRRHARVADGRCADERGAGTAQLGGQQWCAVVFACVGLCLLNSTPMPRDGCDCWWSCRFLFIICFCIARARLVSLGSYYAGVFWLGLRFFSAHICVVITYFTYCICGNVQRRTRRLCVARGRWRC